MWKHELRYLPECNIMKLIVPSTKYLVRILPILCALFNITRQNPTRTRIAIKAGKKLPATFRQRVIIYRENSELKLVLTNPIE